MKSPKKPSNVSRRKALQLLAALGITGPAAAEVLAQAGNRELTTEILKTANSLVDQEFSEERLRIAAAAIQRSLDQFQLVRDLDIDDSIEPAYLFNARGRS